MLKLFNFYKNLEQAMHSLAQPHISEMGFLSQYFISSQSRSAFIDHFTHTLLSHCCFYLWSGKYFRLVQRIYGQHSQDEFLH